MGFEEMDNHDIRTDVELLKKDVHSISRLVDKLDVAIDKLTDDSRVLIDKNDVIQNVDQIVKLRAAGYNGLFSFEPFSEKIQNISDPTNEISKSINYLRENCFLN